MVPKPMQSHPVFPLRQGDQTFEASPHIWWVLIQSFHKCVFYTWVQKRHISVCVAAILDGMVLHTVLKT